MKGLNVAGGIGMYGTQGVEDSANTPGGRGAYCRWVDDNGNFWQFSGDPFDYLNDLWKYNPSTNNWTWMKGSSAPFGVAHYGTKCVSDSNNTPGGRYENRVAWKDQNNLWTFGGNSTLDLQNDLWKYCIATNEWTWISGDTTGGPLGNWGTLGVSSPTNKPDGRGGAVGWTDGSGHLYLWGGSAVPFAGTPINDLWKFTIDNSCAPCNLVAPTALFTAPNHFCENNCTDFTNISINATSYQWIFDGGTPDTSTAANPQNICYDSSGTFSVTLIATNASGTDTLTLNNYITVYQQPTAPVITQSGDTLSVAGSFSTYQWYFGSDTIAGATENNYVATQSGNYNIVVTDENGCAVGAGIVNVIAGSPTPAIHEGEGVAVFPNPAHNSFTIKNLSSKEKIFLQILNPVGEIVYSSPLTPKGGIAEVSMAELKAGIYFVHLQSKNGIVVRKFVKE
jgi:hypothetical protein